MTTTPEGIAQEASYELSLSGAPLGGRQAAWLNITTASLAGLTLTRLCFLGESEECELETSSGFALCAGRVTQPQDCQRPDVPSVLQAGDRLQATLSSLLRPTLMKSFERGCSLSQMTEMYLSTL